MDPAQIVAGALFLIWPLTYHRSMRRIRKRIAAQGGDPEEFRRRMDRPWIRVALVIAPVAGVVLIVIGATR